MKKISLAKMTAALAALAMLAAAPAFAETTIGIINVQKVMAESKAGSAMREQLQAKQKAFQADFDSKQKSLQADEQAIAKSRSSLSKEAFEQKVKDFNNKAAKAQQEVQEKKARLDKAVSEAVEEIRSNVFDIAKQIASDKKLNVVMTADQIMYADSSLDVTDDVLKRLNDKLPSVKVNF